MINFSYVERQGMTVAQVVAEEVMNNLRWGKEFLSPNFGTRPILLAPPVTRRKDAQATVTCRYEGGCVIKVYLQAEAGNVIGDREAEYWLVANVEFRLYMLDPAGRQISNEKTPGEFGFEELTLLKQFRCWHHPHIAKPILCENVDVEEVSR